MLELAAIECLLVAGSYAGSKACAIVSKVSAASVATTVDAIKRFFEVAIPTRVAADVDRFFSIDGNIAFSVRNIGVWTLTFASAEPIVPKFERLAKLQLWFTPDAMKHFIEGDLDVSHAVAAGDVKFKGDVELLVVFGNWLTGQSGLGWEAT